jgi:hypothetical protein
MLISSISNESIVHVHISVHDKHRPYGAEQFTRVAQFTKHEFDLALDTLIEYALKNNDEGKSLFNAHFNCGCVKRYISNGKVNKEDEMDSVCDIHWKEDILSAVYG